MKTLTIVVPFYNENKRIENIIKALEKGFNFNWLKLEKIIFVNDGSTDTTDKKINAAQLENYLNIPIEVIGYKTNQGRGYAVRLGCIQSITDYTLYLDADFSIPLANLNSCRQYIRQNYDLIIGSKKKPGSIARIPRGFIRNFVGYGHSLIASLLLGVYIWDFQGGFKLFSKKFIKNVFPSLKQSRWGLDMEVIYLANKLGYRIREIPVVWSHQDKESKVKLLRDIFRSLKDMIEIRFNLQKPKSLFLPTLRYQ